MKIPNENECFDLLNDMSMMPHIVDHSIMVRNVAVFLADQLHPVYPKLNKALICAAALLHDITKTRSFTTGEKHADTGGEYLFDLGYEEVAGIVRQHVVLDAYQSSGPVNEAEIVNYADKRVLHDQVVPLDQRMDYILEKYASTSVVEKRIRIVWLQTQELESKIFAPLGISPGQLDHLINCFLEQS